MRTLSTQSLKSLFFIINLLQYPLPITVHQKRDLSFHVVNVHLVLFGFFAQLLNVVIVDLCLDPVDLLRRSLVL